MNLHHRPLFWFGLCYVCGIVLAAQAGLQLLPVLGISAGLAAGVCLSRPGAGRLPVSLVCASVLLLGFLRAWLYVRVPAQDISRHADGQVARVVGSVASDPEPLVNGTRFLLKVEGMERAGSVCTSQGLVMVTSRSSKWNPASSPVFFFGDRLEVRGVLREPSPATNPGGGDYSRYLARKRVFCTMSVYRSVKPLSPAPHTLRWAASRLKAGIISKVLEHLPSTQGWFVLGILIGNYAALPAGIQQAFMKSGTLHLLAASGFNCAVVVGIFGFLFRRLTLRRSHTIILLLILLWILAVVAGASPSIVRASIMLSLFLLAHLLRRAPETISLTLLAALVILGLNPLALYDAGFQLSFAALLSIVLIVPLIERKTGPWFSLRGSASGSLAARRLVGAAAVIVEAVAVSAAAMVGTWPITAYYFNYVSTVALAANALTAMLILPLTAAGIVLIVLACIHPLMGKIAAIPVSAASWIIIREATSMGSWSWSCISVRSPSRAFMLAYYIGVLLVLEYVYRKNAGVHPVSDTGRR